MSSNLSTKLRSLVARSFKAEKLYISSANDASGRYEPRSIATEVKAKEWGEQYKQLRVSLNRMLRESPSGELSSSVVRLLEESAKTVTQCDYALTRLHMEVPVASRKQEYSRLLSLSKQLLQLNARKLAAHSIHEELVSILESSLGRKAYQALLQSREQQESEEETTQSAVNSGVVVQFPKASGAN